MTKTNLNVTKRHYKSKRLKRAKTIETVVWAWQVHLKCIHSVLHSHNKPLLTQLSRGHKRTNLKQPQSRTGCRTEAWAERWHDWQLDSLLPKPMAQVSGRRPTLYMARCTDRSTWPCQWDFSQPPSCPCWSDPSRLLCGPVVLPMQGRWEDRHDRE